MESAAEVGKAVSTVLVLLNGLRVPVLLLCLSSFLPQFILPQVFSRLGTKEILGDLDLPLFSHLGSVQAGLAPASVVEVCGCEGVGKTELLLNMAARCVLPKSWKGVEMSGRGVGVVCICTDYKFSVLRLASVLDRRICSVLAHSSGADLSPSSKSAAAHTAVTSNAECQGQRVHMEIDQLIHECLSRIHLLYCSSVPELVAALDSLQTFLLGHPEVCLLMVDPADGFCWMDRVECRGCREFEQRQSQWVGALSRLSREHHLVVVATRLRVSGESTVGRHSLASAIVE